MARNMESDKEITQYYVDNKWHIKRIWEHEIKEDLQLVIKEIIHFIDQAKKLN